MDTNSDEYSQGLESNSLSDLVLLHISRLTLGIVPCDSQLEIKSKKNSREE